ncbi:MAG TPA: ABC transporter permease subunit [bacterium]|jgi:ABC-type transport system involved in multi-copper enzyme maturation permease subunit|nr:ABC transporter permease subunit [bacterium]
MGVEFARRAQFGARALTIYAAAALLFQYLLVLVFRTLDLGTLGPVMDMLPQGLRALMGAEAAELLSPRGFLAVVFVHPVMLVLYTAFVIAFASGALAGEIERRSIALILVRRVTRRQIVGGVALMLLLGTSVLMALLWVGTAVWTTVYDLGPVDLTAFAWVAGTGLAVLWALGGVALLASAATSESGRAAGLAVAFAIAAYVANYLANLSGEWKWLKPYSVFGYWDPQEIVRQGTGQWTDLYVPLAVAAAAVILALIVFGRRDIAV